MALTKISRSLLNTGVADSSDATAITISSDEDATFAGHILLADSKNVKLGAGTDLQLYHDGSNSYLTNSTGALKIATETSGIAVTIGHTTSETTIADNLTVTGTVAAGVITADGLDMGDSEKIRLGASQDLEVYHDGSHSYVYDGGTGNIVLKTNNGAEVDVMGGSEYMAKFIKDGAVELYYDDSKKIETTSAGATVTGTLTATLTGNVTGNVTGNASGTAATVTTAAQTNITSLGTLTALTVDDVAIDGKVITMTGSASDTAVFTAGTNGTLSIVTTDAAAAAANIQITADGTVDIDSAGVLTLDSGAAINIEPASGSAILLDGTISVDAGVVTGATSITSTAFVGDITGDVTGNVSGTAATVTTAAQTNITSLGTLSALTVDDITIDGSTISDGGALEITSGDDLTIDVVGDIHLDADGGDVTFKDGGTLIAKFTNSSSDFVITTDVDDKDIIFKGQDSTSEITALTLDMSEAGKAIFTGAASIGGDFAVTGTSTFAHGVFDAGNATIQLKNGNDNYYVWRNLDSTNDLDLRYNSTQLFAYDQSTTKWDWRGAHTVLESALTDGSTAVNAGTTNNFTLVLEENTTIGQPSNASAGQVLVFEISQHSSSGPYTLAWNSVFEFAASTAPTMTATDNKCDIFTFRYNGSKWQEIGRVQNMAVS